MTARYVIALDQGTTSSRAVLVDAQGRAVDAVQNPFPQIYPQPGWLNTRRATSCPRSWARWPSSR